MTDQQLENYIGSIKSGVINSGEFVDVLAAEIRRLRLAEASSVITNDAFLMVQEKDRQEIARLRSVIEKIRALHPAQFTRADVMKILKED